MRKIIFVRRQDIKSGGAENYLRRLINELKKREIDFEILHLTQPKWLPSWLKFLYYDYQLCRLKDDKFYFSNDRLSCIDINRAGGGVHRVFLKIKGFTLNPLHLVYLHLEKNSFRNSKHIIAISDMVKNEIIENYKVEPKKITTIYNGVEIKEVKNKDMAEAKRNLFKEFQIKNDKKVILYVGSGFKRKGVAEFLEILSKVDRDFIAFVVGKEKKPKKYRELAKSFGLEEKVIFTGVREDVDKFYKSSDIFLFPTHYEPFGNVILEAMSFFNVIITTKQCGAGEIIEDSPIMESPKDYKIVEFIQEVLDDSKKMESIKIKNRKTAEKYSIQKNVDETIELIKRVQSENTSN